MCGVDKSTHPARGPIQGSAPAEVDRPPAGALSQHRSRLFERDPGPIVEVDLAWADVESEGQPVELDALCKDTQVVAQFLGGGAGKAGQADVYQRRRDLQALPESDGSDAGALPR